MSGDEYEQSPLDDPDDRQAIVVRPIRSEDEDAVVNLNVMAWKVGFKGVMDDTYLDAKDPSTAQRPSALLEGKPNLVELVAVLGDEPIAWLASYPTEDEDLDAEKVFEIKDCYTHPDHWRRGAARLLIQSLWDQLKGSQWEAVVLWTPRDAARSRIFYESVGFALDGGTKDWNYGAGEVVLVRYRRSL